MRQNLEIVGTEGETHSEHNQAQNHRLTGTRYPFESFGTKGER